MPAKVCVHVSLGHPYPAMSSKRDTGWLSSDPRGGDLGAPNFADSVSQGVFVLRKAPVLSKRVTARKSFVPLVPDETNEGMEQRRDAYLECWRETDSDINAVLRDANRDAFEKLQTFVMDGFQTRQELVRSNGGVLPQHATQRIPVGLVLAGGVNSDDHEETFSKLTKHLRKVGCHTALLRSRDLKARGGSIAANAIGAVAAAETNNETGGGGGAGNTAAANVPITVGGSGGAGGGLGVAVRRILEQLQFGAARLGATAVGSNLRVSGRSVRHLKRWYVEITENESTTAGVNGEMAKDSNARSTEELDGEVQKTSMSPPQPQHPKKLTNTAVKLKPAPVVIVLEDTEGFDSKILGDLLLALSDASDEIPVCVLLGVATSAAMVHSLLPAAVAARLKAQAFKLYSPKSVMAAVQSRALMDPGRVPALSNAALELLATRFKEHDFSLSAARRAMHLLTLDHFMQTPLSALAHVASAGAKAARDVANEIRTEFQSENNDESAHSLLITTDDVVRDIGRDYLSMNLNDTETDAEAVAALASRARRVAQAVQAATSQAAERGTADWLTPKSLAWARKHLELEEASDKGTTADEKTHEAIKRALQNAYPARRKWSIALRCVALAAETGQLKNDKGELSNVFVDASSAKWMSGDGGEGDKKRGKRKQQTEKQVSNSRGDSLLRLLRSRVERRETSVDAIRALVRRWCRLIALDPELYDAYGQDLNHVLTLCDLAENGEEGTVGQGKTVGAAPDLNPVAAMPRPAAAAANPPPSTRTRRRRSTTATTPVRPTPNKTDDAPENDAEKDTDDAFDLTSPDGAAVAAALVARRRAGPDRARALELAAAERGKKRRDDGDKTGDKASSPGRKHNNTGEDTEQQRTGLEANKGETTDRQADAARAKASSFLLSITKTHASRPPSSLPGMQIFCVTSTERLRKAVQAAPRLALEQQMATPQPSLRCGCCPPTGGASNTLPDACAAYTLLQDAGDAANVHEWFRNFCELHAPAKGSGDSTGGRKGKKSRMVPEVVEAEENPDDDEDQPKGKETFSLEKRKLWELQARFTRAAAELEFLGVARPVKRRKVEYMQRTAFPLDQLLGDDGA